MRHGCVELVIDNKIIRMASFGELVLVLGDLNIPERANAIPENFQRQVLLYRSMYDTHNNYKIILLLLLFVTFSQNKKNLKFFIGCWSQIKCNT